MSPTMLRASYGASLVFTIRQSRCSTMPETVCTIEVNAAIGTTYRAVSIARFSASRSICFSRSWLVVARTYRSSFRIASASSLSSADNSA